MATPTPTTGKPSIPTPIPIVPNTPAPGPPIIQPKNECFNLAKTQFVLSSFSII